MLRRTAYVCGVIAGGLVLGVLLFVALTTLLASAGGARLFRYQAF